MSIPLFLPIPEYVAMLSLKKPLTIRELCAIAGVRCRASGAWVDRKVEIVKGKVAQVVSEPGDWGNVRVVTNTRNSTERARFALAVLAYSLHDLVAKQSISGENWSRIQTPRGRRRTGQALTSRERQRRYRLRHS